MLSLTLRTWLVELGCGQHADGSSVTKSRGQTVRDWTCVIKTNEMQFLFLIYFNNLSSVYLE